MNGTERRTRGWMLPALLLCLTVTAGCAYPVSPSGRVSVQGPGASVSVSFNERDRLMIRDYYVKKIPPGQAKKGRIPPGHQKKLAPNAVLASGQSYQALPVELEARLAPLPTGYARIRVDGGIALLNLQTRVVCDVIDGI